MVPVIQAPKTPANLLPKPNLTSVLQSPSPPLNSSMINTITTNSIATTSQIKSEPSPRSEDVNDDAMDDDSDNDNDQSDGSNSSTSSLHLRCPTCGRVCSDPAHLSNHIKLVHSNMTSKIERKLKILMPYPVAVINNLIKELN